MCALQTANSCRGSAYHLAAIRAMAASTAVSPAAIITDPSAAAGLNPAPADELDWLSSATLARREKQLRGADNSSNTRHLYFKPNADFERLIAACTARIAQLQGSSASGVLIRALLIRASALLKKGACMLALQERERERERRERERGRGREGESSAVLLPSKRPWSPPPSTPVSGIGEVRRALADYEEAARLEPDNAEAALKLASAYESVRELEQAISAYTRVLQLDPHNSQALLRRASCRNLQGDYAGANGAAAGHL